jgi:hypothetical protein
MARAVSGTGPVEGENFNAGVDLDGNAPPGAAHRSGTTGPAGLLRGRLGSARAEGEHLAGRELSGGRCSRAAPSW